MPKKFWLLKISVWTVFFLLACETVFPQEFSEKGIGLMEVVKSTLAREPNIKIQEQDVKAKEGSLKITRGDFDLRLGGYIQHSRDMRLPAFIFLLIYSQCIV